MVNFSEKNRIQAIENICHMFFLVRDGSCGATLVSAGKDWLPHRIFCWGQNPMKNSALDSCMSHFIGQLIFDT